MGRTVQTVNLVFVSGGILFKIPKILLKTPKIVFKMQKLVFKTQKLPSPAFCLQGLGWIFRTKKRQVGVDVAIGSAAAISKVAIANGHCCSSASKHIENFDPRQACHFHRIGLEIDFFGQVDPFSSMRKIWKDKTILMLCVTVFLSYLPEAGQYSCFFVYLRLVMDFSKEAVAMFIAAVGILSGTNNQALSSP